MKQILLAFGEEQICDRITSMLRSHGYPLVRRCRYASQVMQLASEIEEGGLVICPSRLSDRSAMELKSYLSPAFRMIVLVSHKNDIPDIYEYNDDFGQDVVTLTTPVSTLHFLETVELMLGTRHGSLGRRPPRRTDEEDRMICEAKTILMERNGMTEQQAHRFIQKRSMTLSQKMADVALSILNGW